MKYAQYNILTIFAIWSDTSVAFLWFEFNGKTLLVRGWRNGPSSVVNETKKFHSFAGEKGITRQNNRKRTNR